MSLGFLNLNKKNNKVAEYDFSLASYKARTREQADRALFWAWKANGNRSFLKKLSRSYSINLYSLAGKDALGEKYDLGVTPRLPRGKLKGFNITRPYCLESS